MAETIWTQDDIDALKKAVAAGVLTVNYSNGATTRSITYQSLGAMRALLAEMVRAVNGAATYRLASTRKGLGA